MMTRFRLSGAMAMGPSTFSSTTVPSSCSIIPADGLCEDVPVPDAVSLPGKDVLPLQVPFNSNVEESPRRLLLSFRSVERRRSRSAELKRCGNTIRG